MLTRCPRRVFPAKFLKLALQRTLDVRHARLDPSASATPTLSAATLAQGRADLASGAGRSARGVSGRHRRRRSRRGAYSGRRRRRQRASRASRTAAVNTRGRGGGGGGALR